MVKMNEPFHHSNTSKQIKKIIMFTATETRGIQDSNHDIASICHLNVLQSSLSFLHNLLYVLVIITILYIRNIVARITET